MISSKRKPNLIETVRGKEFYNNIFQILIEKNNIKQYSRNTYLRAVFADCFDGSIRDLLKRPVFGNGNGKWIDLLQTTTKQYINRVHTSTRLTLVGGSLKENEGFVYKNLLHKRKKIKPKFQLNKLVKTADLNTRFLNRILVIGLIDFIKLVKYFRTLF